MPSVGRRVLSPSPALCVRCSHVHLCRDYTPIPGDKGQKCSEERKLAFPAEHDLALVSNGRRIGVRFPLAFEQLSPLRWIAVYQASQPIERFFISGRKFRFQAIFVRSVVSHELRRRILVDSLLSWRLWHSLQVSQCLPRFQSLWSSKEPFRSCRKSFAVTKVAKSA